MNIEGICQVSDDTYSIAIKFSDINYQIADIPGQRNIFSMYSELLSSFDSQTKFQILINNRSIDPDSFKEKMLIPMQNDDKDKYRKDMNNMLIGKAIEGDNNILKEKYLIISVTAEDYKSAVQKLRRLETEKINHFSKMGCYAQALTGTQYLGLISSMINPGENLKFDYLDLIFSGLSTKGFVAPYFADFRPFDTVNSRYSNKFFEIGDYYGAVLKIKGYPSDLSDDIVDIITTIPANITISIQGEAVEQSEAISILLRKKGFVEQDKMNQQMKLIRQLADPDMITQDVKMAEEGLADWISKLNNDNQKMFKASFYVFVTAKDVQQLITLVEKVQGAARAKNVQLMPIPCQQKEALKSCLPFATDIINQPRFHITGSLAVMTPFTSQELYDENGMYYGLNAISHNMLFFNRRGLDNPAGWVLGTPGSGKSFATKREILNIILSSDGSDDIIVIDPECEYTVLCEQLGGSVIKISTDTKNYINPLEIDKDLVDENPIQFKTEFFLSMCELIVNKPNGTGLSSEDRTIIDYVLTKTYDKYLNDRSGKVIVPTLMDFYNNLLELDIPAAKQLASDLGLYVTGSFDLFAHQTNVNLDNNFVVFDIKDLGSQVKTLGMLNILSTVWSRVTRNRKLGRRTWIIIDEAHLMFKNGYSADFLSSLWKRARKYGGVCTGITQNVQELLRNELANLMLSNSEFVLMLNQSESDRLMLQQIFHMSDQQLSYVTNRGSGQGLLKAGRSLVPFVDKFPRDNLLYPLMTTKLEEVVARDQNAEAM